MRGGEIRVEFIGNSTEAAYYTAMQVSIEPLQLDPVRPG